jgi:hypothetical protein
MVERADGASESQSVAGAEDELPGLTLNEALREHCDPALVAAYDAAVAEDAKFKAGGVWLGPVHFDRNRTIESRAIKDRKLAQVANNLRGTRHALERDLRRQIERDRLYIFGNQIRPLRKLAPLWQKDGVGC